MTTTVVKMPQLGESVSEGTIGRWLKQPGERVERDEPLVEIQTDKVNAEVPSPVAGILQQILLPEGTTAAVKTDMAIIGDEAPTSAPAAPATPPPAAPAPPSFSYDKSASGGVVGHREPEPTAAPAPEPSSDGEKRFYTPVVIRMAQEHDIDLSKIQGTGAHGRVTRKDVERAIAAPATPGDVAPIADAVVSAQPGEVVPIVDAAVSAAPREALPVSPPSSAAAASAPTPPPVAPDDEQRPLTPMRRAIADHMARARRDIPDAWSLTEIDVTRLVKYRDSLQADWQAREGYELTYLPFFIKAVLAGLRAVPDLNATFQGDRIVVHHHYHLGIAVSVDSGLVVPVLRDADQLSVAGVARALRQLVQKARGGKLAVEDLQGATFTVNNPGSLGSIMSQPIVPVGQTGIVTMEAIVKRPVVTADDAIAIRSMMNSCLSFDHRVLDGAGALIFLRTLRQQLESVDYQLY
jgi:2-oxoisovalerate dehydrogenase E2 component (dihydrolipoyl transacylase)